MSFPFLLNINKEAFLWDNYANHEIQEAVDTAKRNRIDDFLFQNPFGRRRSKCMCNKCRKERQEAEQEEVGVEREQYERNLYEALEDELDTSKGIPSRTGVLAELEPISQK